MYIYMYWEMTQLSTHMYMYHSLTYCPAPDPSSRTGDQGIRVHVHIQKGYSTLIYMDSPLPTEISVARQIMYALILS